MVWGKFNKEKMSLIIFSFWAFPIFNHICVIEAPSGGHAEQLQKDSMFSLCTPSGAASSP
jgi:hypothetical protein